MACVLTIVILPLVSGICTFSGIYWVVLCCVLTLFACLYFCYVFGIIMHMMIYVSPFVCISYIFGMLSLLRCCFLIIFFHSIPWLFWITLHWNSDIQRDLSFHSTRYVNNVSPHSTYLCFACSLMVCENSCKWPISKDFTIKFLLEFPLYS